MKLVFSRYLIATNSIMSASQLEGGAGNLKLKDKGVCATGTDVHIDMRIAIAGRA